MSFNCCDNEPKFDGVSGPYKRALWAVIAINGTMFVVEMSAGMLSGSQALQADALDFLGDTATYAISMFVIGMPLIWRTRAALFKGLSLGAIGLWVFGSTAYQFLVLDVPQAEVMGAIGFLALTANLISVLLLMKYRDGDANRGRSGPANARRHRPRRLRHRDATGACPRAGYRHRTAIASGRICPAARCRT